MSSITARKVLPERSTRNKKNSWKEKDEQHETEARKIAPSKKNPTRVSKPSLDLDWDDSSLLPLATSTQFVDGDTENQLGILDKESSNSDNDTDMIPGTPRKTSSSRKRKGDSPTPSTSKADSEYSSSVSRDKKTKSTPLVVKAKSVVTSINASRSHKVSGENGITNPKGKNATRNSYGKTGSNQSHVENNGVICLPANRSQQDSNFEQGVLPNRSRVQRGTLKSNSSSLRRDENDSSFLTRNVGNTPNGSKQSQVENNGVISLQANRSQDSNFEQGVLPNRSRVHRETLKSNSSSLRRDENDFSFLTRNVGNTPNHMDRKLATLDLKADYIIDKLNSVETLLKQLLKSNKSHTPTQFCKKSAFPPHIRFPIENLQTFNEVESLLGDSEEAKQYMIDQLFIQSDDTIFKSLVRMLKHVLSDSLFMKFTWCGSRKNTSVMKFETTKIRDCAFAAMVLKFKDSQPILVKEFNTHGILIFTRMRNNIKTKLKNKGRILDDEIGGYREVGSDDEKKGSDEEDGSHNEESEKSEDDEDGEDPEESEHDEDNDGEDSVD